MSDQDDRFTGWFRAASPYIHVHRGRTFVVQLGDDLVNSSAFNNLVHDLALLTSVGIRLIIVYATRHSIDALVTDRNLPAQFHDGKRLTDSDSMATVKEVAGRLLVEIQACLSMGMGNTPMSNAELNVSSGNYVTARPLGVIGGVDYRFTGAVRSIDTDSIRASLDRGEIVVVPPLGYSITGEAFNLAADELAADIAIALQADKLLYLLDAGVMADLLAADSNRQMTREQAAKRISKEGGNPAAAHFLQLAHRACCEGITRIHFLDQYMDGAILHELFTRDGVGCMVTTSIYDELRQAETADIAGILELISPLEAQGYLVQRSREKLELEIDRFTVLSRDGVLTGCIALFPYGDVAELACLAVHPENRNDGRGDELLSAVEKEAKTGGIRQLFVLTTHADHWFLERGFSESSIEALPVEKQNIYNYQRNSKVLVKTL